MSEKSRGAILIRLTIDEWQKVDEVLNGRSLSNYVFMQASSILKPYSCIEDGSLPMIVNRNLRVQEDIHNKIDCISSKLGISVPEFIRRYILEEITGKNKLPTFIT